MDTLEQHISSHEHFFATKIHDRAVIADGFLSTGLHGVQVLCEVLNQPKLP